MTNVTDTTETASRYVRILLCADGLTAPHRTTPHHTAQPRLLMHLSVIIIIHRSGGNDALCNRCGHITLQNQILRIQKSQWLISFRAKA